MRRSRRPVVARVAVLAVAVLSPVAASAQLDEIPADQLGLWVPAKSDCKSSSLKLELAPKTMKLTNGNDRVSHGNVGLGHSYFGNSYLGIKFVAMPDWDKTQPYVVILNAKEKKGQAEINFNDAALKKRFPLEGVLLKRCASSPTPAAK